MDDMLFSRIPHKDPRLMNPVVLAYLGDAVYETYVRLYLLSLPNHRPHHLHREATRYVSAKAQAKTLERLEPDLTEEEREIVRKGRNAKSGHPPKNTGVLEYRHSTALECLFGYLFCQKRYERLKVLMEKAIEVL